MVFICSCKKEEQVIRISIKNNMPYTLSCKFYPTKEANGYILDYEIDTSTRVFNIYNSTNINQSPSELLKNAYDSFSISIPELNKKLIFKKDLTVNYSINPYTNPEKWVLKEYSETTYTNLRQKKTNIDDYLFVISLENIPNE
jgi:hypothetical protein